MRVGGDRMTNKMKAGVSSNKEDMINIRKAISKDLNIPEEKAGELLTMKLKAVEAATDFFRRRLLTAEKEAQTTLAPFLVATGEENTEEVYNDVVSQAFVTLGCFLIASSITRQMPKEHWEEAKEKAFEVIENYLEKAEMELEAMKK